jgi:hypothetical protein
MIKQLIKKCDLLSSTDAFTEALCLDALPTVLDGDIDLTCSGCLAANRGSIVRLMEFIVERRDADIVRVFDSQVGL